MTIGRIEPGRQPMVQKYGNEVAVWVDNGGDPAGLTMRSDTAVVTALAMLAAASAIEGNRPVALPIRSVELLESAEVNEDVAARLVFDADGAPLAVDISAMNLAMLAAELAAASRKIG